MSRGVCASNTELEAVFQHVFVAKKVRSDTAIGENPVSVAYLCGEFGAEDFADLFIGFSVLLIGAGGTIELVAQHLKQSNKIGGSKSHLRSGSKSRRAI